MLPKRANERENTIHGTEKTEHKANRQNGPFSAKCIEEAHDSRQKYHIVGKLGARDVDEHDRRCWEKQGGAQT